MPPLAFVAARRRVLYVAQDVPSTEGVMDSYTAFLHQLLEMKRAPARGRAAPPGDQMPYKPLLVLAVLRIVRHTSAGENRFAPLVMRREFDALFAAAYARPGRSGVVLPSAFVQPFWFLKSSPFWRLVAVDGRAADLAALLTAKAEVRSLAQLAALVAHASIHPPELLEFLRDPRLVDIAARVVLSTYFDEPYRGLLDGAYSDANFLRDDGNAVGDATHPFWSRIAAPTARSLFRGYQGRCAVCRLTVMGDLRFPPVDEAHVRPRSWGGGTDSANLILLCKLHHWAFDAGVLTVDPKGIAHVSSLCADGDAFEQTVARYENQPIFTPSDPALKLSEVGLAWHGAKIFLGPCRGGHVP